MMKENLNPVLLRDLLHNLDPEDEVHANIYNQARYLFISQNEGVLKVAYDDATGKPVTDINNIIGKVTIGVGFNMDAVDARKVWDNVFEGEINFDSVKEGKIKLTEDQVKELYDESIRLRVTGLKVEYGNVFSKFRLNERLAIEDAYFNSPRLVDRSSNFFRHINKYYATSESEYLVRAVDEIKNRSNPKKIPGIQNRRNKQAELLNSLESPFYSAPFDVRLPKKAKIFVFAEEMVIPRGVEKWERGGNPNYYIWRTQCDEKVRASHFLQEGRIFARNNPPSLGHPKEAYNCRCWEEELPKNMIVVDEKYLDDFEDKIRSTIAKVQMELKHLRMVHDQKLHAQHNLC